MAAFFHLHKRKRIHQKCEPYPHPNKWKRWLDKIIYGAGIAGPILVAPQALKIWFGQNAVGVSTLSWSGFTIVAIIWLTYGIAHKEKPIIVMYSGLVIMNSFVTIGAFIYG